MRNRVWLALLLFHSAIGIRHPAHAQVPQLINYQGRLLNGTNLVNGSVGLSLRLFNVSSGGTKIYEDSNTVTVADGLYSTFIGDHPTNDALLVALTNPAVWVEVAVNGAALTPRERLASVGYALSTRGLLVTTNGSIVLNPDLGANSIAASSAQAIIAGGRDNDIGTNSGYSAIGGGFDNNVANVSLYATIAGGGLNDIGTNSGWSAIGGGYANNVADNSTAATIGGGYGNNVADNSRNTTIAGGYGNYIEKNASSSAIGGGHFNTVADDSGYASVAGGLQNEIGTNASYSAIGGGFGNRVSAGSEYATIPGGHGNFVGADATNALAAGRQAHALHRGTFVWADDTPTLFASTANNQFLVRAGGGVGINHTAPEGALHVRAGSAGAVTAADGSVGVFECDANGFVSVLVPTDATAGLMFGSETASNDCGVYYNTADTRDLRFRVGFNTVRMTITTNGYVGIGTTSPTGLLHVAGNAYAAAWLTTSDRHAKQDIAPVDAAAILEKISALPVATWSFKTEPEVKHIGPMAQDFRAAFGLGPSETAIATVDADGVALAAIQALARENAELKRENRALRLDVEDIRARLGLPARAE